MKFLIEHLSDSDAYEAELEVGPGDACGVIRLTIRFNGQPEAWCDVSAADLNFAIREVLGRVAAERADAGRP